MRQSHPAITIVGGSFAALLLIGIAIPKLTVWDSVPVDPWVKRCAASALYRNYNKPIERVAFLLGKSRIIKADSSSAEMESFTLFRIPMGVLRGRPDEKSGVFCDFPGSPSGVSGTQPMTTDDGNGVASPNPFEKLVDLGKLSDKKDDARFYYGAAVFVRTASEGSRSLAFVLPGKQYVTHPLSSSSTDESLRIFDNRLFEFDHGRINEFSLPDGKFVWLPSSEGVWGPATAKVIDLRASNEALLFIACDFPGGTTPEDCTLRRYDRRVEDVEVIGSLAVDLYESPRIDVWDDANGVATIETLGGEGPAGFGSRYEIDLRRHTIVRSRSIAGVATCDPSDALSSSCTQKERDAFTEFDKWREQWKGKFELISRAPPYTCGATVVDEAIAGYLGCFVAPRDGQLKTTTDIYSKLQYDYPAFWGESTILRTPFEVMHGFSSFGFDNQAVLAANDPLTVSPGRGGWWGDIGRSITSEAAVKEFCSDKKDCLVHRNRHGVLIARWLHEVEGGPMIPEGEIASPQYFIFSPNAQYSGITLSPVRLAMHDHDDRIIKDFDAVVDSIRYIR